MPDGRGRCCRSRVERQIIAVRSVCVERTGRANMPYASNDGVRIYYEREGSGPPLVLHHGFTRSLEGWRDNGYADVLNTEYELILMDARGHGRSDKPHDPAAYAPEQ